MKAPAGIAEFDPGEVLRVLEEHEVRYVVIGALAAIVAGAPLLTSDLDITPARDETNLQRLVFALRDLHGTLRVSNDPEGAAFPIDVALLRNAESSTLSTRAGSLDLVFSPAGTRGYDDLKQDARPGRIGGLIVPVASLLDVIRCKEAARRPKDLQALPILRQTLEEVRRLEREERGR
jgi:hypothetical protein